MFRSLRDVNQVKLERINVRYTVIGVYAYRQGSGAFSPITLFYH